MKERIFLIPSMISLIIVERQKKKIMIIYNLITKKNIRIRIGRDIKICIKQNKVYIRSFIKNTVQTIYTLLNNCVEDLIFTYQEVLLVKGAGFKVGLSSSGRHLLLLLGYSHIVFIRIPYSIFLTEGSANGSFLEVKGIARQVVYQFIAIIKKLKKVDSYKGKGLFLSSDILLLKKPKTAEKK